MDIWVQSWAFLSHLESNWEGLKAGGSNILAKTFLVVGGADVEALDFTGDSKRTSLKVSRMWLTFKKC